MHLTKWERIYLPKSMGGRGIKNIHWFSIALRLKCFWSGSFGTRLCSEVLKSKYLKNLSVVEWIRLSKKLVSNVSNF